MVVKRLIWDIETSPNLGYFWRAGYKIRIDPENIVKERAIICICYKWEHQTRVNSLRWDNGDDRQMIADFIPIANEADELVAHNGDKFDMKWFNGRVLFHQLGPIPEYKTVDTLVIARRRFALNSNRLDYLGKLLLGEGKVHTDFNLWKKVCNGNKSALDYMVRYCRADVSLLQRVWDRLKPFHKPKTHSGVLMNRDRWTCPEDGSMNVERKQIRVSTAGVPRHMMRCKKCLRHFTIPQNVYENWVEACIDAKKEKA